MWKSLSKLKFKSSKQPHQMGAAQQNYLNKIFKLKETVAGFDFNLTAARDGCTFNSSYSQDNGG